MRVQKRFLNAQRFRTRLRQRQRQMRPVKLIDVIEPGRPFIGHADGVPRTQNTRQVIIREGVIGQEVIL